MGANLLGNILAGKKATKSKSQGRRLNSAGKKIVRAGYGNKKVRKTTTRNRNNF